MKLLSLKHDADFFAFQLFNESSLSGEPTLRHRSPSCSAPKPVFIHSLRRNSLATPCLTIQTDCSHFRGLISTFSELGIPSALSSILPTFSLSSSVCLLSLIGYSFLLIGSVIYLDVGGVKWFRSQPFCLCSTRYLKLLMICIIVIVNNKFSICIPNFLYSLVNNKSSSFRIPL